MTYLWQTSSCSHCPIFPWLGFCLCFSSATNTDICINVCMWTQPWLRQIFNYTRTCAVCLAVFQQTHHSAQRDLPVPLVKWSHTWSVKMNMYVCMSGENVRIGLPVWVQGRLRSWVCSPSTLPEVTPVLGYQRYRESERGKVIKIVVCKVCMYVSIRTIALYISGSCPGVSSSLAMYSSNHSLTPCNAVLTCFGMWIRS